MKKDRAWGAKDYKKNGAKPIHFHNKQINYRSSRTLTPIAKFQISRTGDTVLLSAIRV